ncbi:MAG: ATP-binding cassette domain-containing protein, partial [Dehalococcoidia bacterium]|nr:ATP-binding cassette domain-containing protein [Dehalococcoidia bacterium]
MPDKTANTIELRVENLDLSFGGVKALDNLSFEVPQGHIVGIIGPNGAGKTSTLNCINGFYRAQHGEIYFRDKRITKLR